jgi:hypothetical protein
MKVGREIIPVMTDFMKIASGDIEAITSLGDAIKESKNGGQSLADWEAEIVNSTLPSFMRGAEDAAQATNDFSGSMDEAAASSEDFEKRLSATAQRMTSLYKEISRGAQDIMRSNKDYTDSLSSLAQDEADIAQRRKDIEFDLYQFRQEMQKKIDNADTAKERAKLTEDLSRKELEYYKKLEENSHDLQGVEEKRLEVDKKKIEADAQKKYNLLEQRALIDGVISSGENEWLLEQAQALGLITPAAKDAAIAQNQWADSMYASFAETQPGMEETLRLMQEMMAYDGHTVNFGVNFASNSISVPRQTGSHVQTGAQTQYTAQMQYYNQLYAATRSNSTSTPTQTGAQTQYTAQMQYYNQLYAATRRDSGGAGIAGTPYLIGRGAQPELFIPSSNGRFVPNADRMGSTYNITINNPKKETSENSIRTALKKLSYTGYAQ